MTEDQYLRNYDIDVDTTSSKHYKFKTITGITNDVVADQMEDTLTLASGNATLGIVGTTATDTITWTWAHLGIESLADAGADKLMFWDDSASATKWATLGTGLAFTDVQLNVSLALNDLSDVSISLPGDSALLMYTTASGLWTAAGVYAWKTIIVAGQDNVVADELADDLTLVACVLHFL
jgi:hypothetical protein